MKSIVAFGFVVVALMGCCAIDYHCPPEEPAPQLYHENEPSPVVDRCIRAMQEAGPRPAEILVLSGGGSAGAWGAGVLRGWWDNEKNPRPERFDVVTGVSTGALMATFAFLGRDYDEELARAYTGIDDSVVQDDRSPFVILFGGSSVRTLDPLEDFLGEIITDATIDAVAARGAEGPALFVATAELNTASFWVWDMTRLAADRAYDRYRAVLRASASIPVLYEPRLMGVTTESKDRIYLHVDGGTREQLFMRPILRAMSDAATRDGRPRPRVSAIVNGRLGLPWLPTEDCLTSIGLRSVEMLLDANTIGSLYQVELLSQQLELPCLLSFIPANLLSPEFSSVRFIPEEMQHLYESGRLWAATSDWPTRVPPLAYRVANP